MADAVKNAEGTGLGNGDTSTSFQRFIRNGSSIIVHSPGDGKAVVELLVSSK